MQTYAGIDLHSSNNFIGVINITAQVFEALIFSFFCVISRRCNCVFDNI